MSPVSQKLPIPNHTVEQIRQVLSLFPEIETATLFGSRAKGTQKRGSDIDLALTGSDIEWRMIGRVYDKLDDLLTPYHFSLIQYNENTDADVSAHIRRVGLPLYERVNS